MKLADRIWAIENEYKRLSITDNRGDGFDLYTLIVNEDRVIEMGEIPIGAVVTLYVQNHLYLKAGTTFILGDRLKCRIKSTEVNKATHRLTRIEVENIGAKQ